MDKLTKFRENIKGMLLMVLMLGVVGYVLGTTYISGISGSEHINTTAFYQNGYKVWDYSGEINAGNISNSSILEVNINCTNSPTDNYILSYDSSSSGFTWIVDAGSNSSEQMQDACGAMATNGDGVDFTYDDVGNTLTPSFDCSDVSGTGLSCSGEDLTVDLGTTIDSSEIVDDSLAEVDLDCTNPPTDNYVLSYDYNSGGFTWVVDTENTDTQDLSYNTVTDVISLVDGGSIDITEVDTNTNAITLCNEYEFLDGAGTCDDLSEFLTKSGGTITGDLNIDDGVGDSPYTYWKGQSDQSGYIYYANGIGLALHGDPYLQIGGGSHVSFYSPIDMGSKDIETTGNINASEFYDNGVAISSTYSPIAGSASITTVGTIGTGVWEGTEIADGHVSNTLTCSNLVSGSSVVSDSEVDNDITASNYLPLAGGTMSGDIVMSGNINMSTNYIYGGQQYNYIQVDGAGNAFSITAQGDIILKPLSTYVLPDANNSFRLGSATKKWKDIYYVTGHAGDIVFLNDISLTECGQGMCFLNQSNSTIMRIEPNGDFQVRGTITENYDFGD